MHTTAGDPCLQLHFGLVFSFCERCEIPGFHLDVIQILESASHSPVKGFMFCHTTCSRLL